MVWAVVLLLLLYSPTLALAEDVQTVETVPVVNESYVIEQKLDTINQTLTDGFREMNEVSEPKGQDDSDLELETLNSIDSKLTQIVGEQTTAGLMEQAPLAASASHAFVAYANMSPTSAYANYAVGLLPKLKWDEHYVLVQDTSSSYTFVWGELVNENNTIAGEGSYVRWYYTGNAQGYREERGSGSVSVTPNGYTVLSDLGEYPMVGGSEELQRREVGFYALVAVVIFVLHSVWRFVLRNSQPY